MEKDIKEQMEVVITETPNVIPKIKELDFNVNTMSSGIVSFATEHINGFLEGIIVDSQNQIQLTVTLEDSNITLFEIQSFQGEQFIPIRLGIVDGFGEHFRDGYSKWALNDKLRFEIKGTMNSEVQFKVRYC